MTDEIYARDCLEPNTTPEDRLHMAQALAAIWQPLALTEDEHAVIESARDQTAAEPMSLFPAAAIPRLPSIKRMHVADAGSLPGGQKGIRFCCHRCNYDTGWIADRWTVAQNMRGHPCPNCNTPSKGTKS